MVKLSNCVLYCVLTIFSTETLQLHTLGQVRSGSFLSTPVSIMGGQSVPHQVSGDYGPDVKSDLELLKEMRELALDMHITGSYCNKHIIQYIYDTTNCLILPSVIASWIHMHYVLRMAELPNMEDQLEFYEVRHTLNDKRSKDVKTLSKTTMT